MPVSSNCGDPDADAYPAVPDADANPTVNGFVLAADRLTAAPLGADAESPNCRRAWLRLHAADLIDRLSDWADDLDRREANLNAAESLRDARDRERRRGEHEAAERLARRGEELAQIARQLDERQQELESRLRRLAFEMR